MKTVVFSRHALRIACKEFFDRLRNGWVVACMVVWLGAIILTSVFGSVQVGRIGVQGYERTVVSLLNLTQYLVPLLALLVGHDLIVSEREDRTLGVVLASGVSRVSLVTGKWIGACLALSIPIAVGFGVAGAFIGWMARDAAVGSFLLLAGSGLALGVVFLSVGLTISTVCRTRMQALVLALLSWCVAVFVFDLVAIGAVMSARAPAVAQEIDLVCDATHVNSVADVHSAFDAPQAGTSQVSTGETRSNLFWILLANPIDLFRAVNLTGQMEAGLPALAAPLSMVAWLLVTVGASAWKFRLLDL